jgi:antitoxin (DNA-binding transcriptional repressor) of toxin-antitoxin stability system
MTLLDDWSSNMTSQDPSSMAATETISASEFKAKCLAILDRIACHDLERVIITKRGQTVAVLTPPEPPAGSVRDIYGFMRGSVTIADDADLTAPALDEPFTTKTGDFRR